MGSKRNHPGLYSKPPRIHQKLYIGQDAGFTRTSPRLSPTGASLQDLGFKLLNRNIRIWLEGYGWSCTEDAGTPKSQTLTNTSTRRNSSRPPKAPPAKTVDEMVEEYRERSDALACTNQVIVNITSSYRNSPSCRLEANMILERRLQGLVRVHFAMLQSGYRGDYWLKAFLEHTPVSPSKHFVTLSHHGLVLSLEYGRKNTRFEREEVLARQELSAEGHAEIMVKWEEFKVCCSQVWHGCRPDWGWGMGAGGGGGGTAGPKELWYEMRKRNNKKCKSARPSELVPGGQR